MAGTFKDIKGGEWHIEPLTIGAVLRVKRDSDGRFNLLEPGEAFASNGNGKPRALFEVLQFDVVEFWETLAHLLAPEIADRGLTAATFGELLAGDALVEAQDLFFIEWQSFFRQLRRPDQAVAMEKLASYKAKAVGLMKARIAGPELQRMDMLVNDKIETILNDSFGSLAASLEPTPGLSVSDNSAG